MSQRKCTIENCDRKPHARGLCGKHYQAKKYDDTLSNYGVTPPPLQFLLDLVGTQQTKCVLWPFSLDTHGYGHLSYKGKTVRAHRLMLFISGQICVGTQQSAHSCGLRNCVNPNHLRFTNQSENQLDRFKHGTMVIAKLTEHEVRQIKCKIASGETNSQIAQDYLVCRTTVGRIRNQKTWKHI